MQIATNLFSSGTETDFGDTLYKIDLVLFTLTVPVYFELFTGTFHENMEVPLSIYFCRPLSYVERPHIEII